MSRARTLALLALLPGCYTEYAGFHSTKPALDGVDTASLDTDLPEAPEVEAPEAEEPEVEAPPVDPPEDPVEEPPADPVDDPPPVDDCVHTSDLIYLVSRSDDGLYLFDPSTLRQTLLGTLDCSPFGDPQSMAVGRDGVGYVRWSDDRVYEVDLETLDCQRTAYSPGAFGAFGMGFATDHAGTWRDQLYIANFTRLAQLDRASWTRRVIGTLPSQAELTGTASGQLWAFLPLETPAALVELDKRTGQAVRTQTLPGFPSPFDIDAFAFAHWGGEFYLFVREYGVGSSTDVYRVDRQGGLTLARRRIGIDVVGAGVSTCAPTQ